MLLWGVVVGHTKIMEQCLEKDVLGTTFSLKAGGQGGAGVAVLAVHTAGVSPGSGVVLQHVARRWVPSAPGCSSHISSLGHELLCSTVIFTHGKVGHLELVSKKRSFTSASEGQGLPARF